MAMARIKRKTTTEMIWPYFLKLLKERPMYGYELRQETQRRFGWKPPTVTSYLVLYSLEKGGYVTVSWKEQRGKPARKYYKITKKGEELLQEAIDYFKETYAKLSA
ncbi:MAG: PadR family transcriptional regulator [Candidatus Hadarchaeum yellowstonense]|jgi:DNA-binding PadR family transcriptional regulator|uniref:PadR family transcriptional regulator n=1 Tax=Hadarchaeum yellowstonense TaxID=1776334 RepID=A0A147JTP9_HADYE|nr:MAG: PadR family transcriptional regulator [Candidatus Hadarchaeum yellowstonense]